MAVEKVPRLAILLARSLELPSVGRKVAHAVARTAASMVERTAAVTAAEMVVVKVERMGSIPVV